MPGLRVVAAGLRRWARGASAEEAAVELLVRSFDGRFADPRWPWVRDCDRPGWYWLDLDALANRDAGFPPSERAVLGVVEALLSGAPLDGLADVLARLKGPELGLVLAALAHAAGPDGDLARLVPWPRCGVAA